MYGALFELLVSPHVTESTGVLDSGFHPSGFRIPTLWIHWIPDSKPLDSGFQPSGFRIPIIWNPDYGVLVSTRIFSSSVIIKTKHIPLSHIVVEQ